jgi:hypothetical protein
MELLSVHMKQSQILPITKHSSSTLQQVLCNDVLFNFCQDCMSMQYNKHLAECLLVYSVHCVFIMAAKWCVSRIKYIALNYNLLDL